MAGASYIPFNTNNKGNIGIGTSTPSGGLVVMNGNVGKGNVAVLMDANGNLGVGTITPSSKLTVLGNVGIGTVGGAYTSITAPVS